MLLFCMEKTMSTLNLWVKPVCKVNKLVNSLWDMFTFGSSFHAYSSQGKYTVPGPEPLVTAPLGNKWIYLACKAI